MLIKDNLKFYEALALLDSNQYICKYKKDYFRRKDNGIRFCNEYGENINQGFTYNYADLAFDNSFAVYKCKPKPVDFSKALEAMKAGATIYRDAWAGLVKDTGIRVFKIKMVQSDYGIWPRGSKQHPITYGNSDPIFNISREDILADDWIIED